MLLKSFQLVDKRGLGMKYVVGAILLTFSAFLNAQTFFGGLVSQGTGGVQAGSESLGASAGGGSVVTGGIAGGVSGSQAQAGATITPGPGINFTSSGASGTLVGSAVGAASNGNAAGGSAAGATGQASHYHAAGFVVLVP